MYLVLLGLQRTSWRRGLAVLANQMYLCRNRSWLQHGLSQHLETSPAFAGVGKVPFAGSDIAGSCSKGIRLCSEAHTAWEYCTQKHLMSPSQQAQLELEITSPGMVGKISLLKT